MMRVVSENREEIQSSMVECERCTSVAGVARGEGHEDDDTEVKWR